MAAHTPKDASDPREVVVGLVERVTFHSQDTGFCVLRVKARGHRDLVTTVGHAAMISAGEWITASGHWINDRTHGLQFKTQFLKTSAPSTSEGIEKYLGSGMIKGIGPVYAKRMVKMFGCDVFDIIEVSPERLHEVDGIGPKRADKITAGWADQKVIREIMVFLHQNGVGTARAVRIFKTYGVDSVQIMSENPYRLAKDIRGIGFRTADQIAEKLGIEKTAMVRVRAGISFALTEAMGNGGRVAWIYHRSELAHSHDLGQATASYLARPSPFILLRMFVPILTSVFWFGKLRAFSLGPMTVFQRPICVSPRLR